MNKLSNNFSIEEFEASDTALRLGINNKMPGDTVGNAKALCQYVLQPVRDAFAIPITITSGYRCLELNRAIGSGDGSQHIKGMAADIKVKGMSPRDVALEIIGLGIEFDQLIYEGNWVHVSWSINNRKKIMTATFKDGKAHYSLGIT